MNVYSIKCPECGAELDVNEGRSSCFCSYCGTKILLDDSVERKEVTHRYVDEAEIVKSRNAIELERMKMEERKRNDKNIWIILIGSAIAFIILFIYITSQGW